LCRPVNKTALGGLEYSHNHIVISQSKCRELSVWYSVVKVIFDYVFSVVAIIILLPVIIFLAIAIKLSDGGPVFHKHERVGKDGKRFWIYKFRSMIIMAENGHPELSYPDDPRITWMGLFMRKYRLDEIPNFINVLKGDMSIVGPRPERMFYIEQIIGVVPAYSILLKIKPGVTSWGQVKYGYASDVDEMIKRMYYDLGYMASRNAFFDLKILLHTVITITRGKGI